MSFARPPAADAAVQLRPRLPSPVYLAYGSDDLDEALAALQQARTKLPEVELRDCTVRIPFTAAGRFAVVLRYVAYCIMARQDSTACRHRLYASSRAVSGR